MMGLRTWSSEYDPRRYARKCTPSTQQEVLLSEKFGKRLLALGEGALHLAADEERVRDRPQKAEADFIIDPVADQCSGYARAGFRLKFVAMVPALEWTFVLHVSEVMIPLEFGDACNPL